MCLLAVVLVYRVMVVSPPLYVLHCTCVLLLRPSSVSFGSAQILFVSSYENDKICMCVSTARV